MWERQRERPSVKVKQTGEQLLLQSPPLPILTGYWCVSCQCLLCVCVCACVNTSQLYYEPHSSHLLLGAEGHLFSTQNFYLSTHTGSDSQALCDKFPSPKPIRKQPFKQRSQEHFLSVGRLTAKRMIDRPLVRDDSQTLELCGSPQARLLSRSPFICMNERFLINRRANEFGSEGSQWGKGTFSRTWRCVNC